jgi:hypothetical protein
MERCGDITKALDRAPWAPDLHRRGLIVCHLQCHAVAQEATAKSFLRLPHLRLPVGTVSAPPPLNARGYEKCPSVRV